MWKHEKTALFGLKTKRLYLISFPCDRLNNASAKLLNYMYGFLWKKSD